MINKVTLIGNLGRDPELRRFENGGVLTKFSIATNENYRDRNGEWQTMTEWHEIICRGPMAERAEKELRKGKLVYIEGRITHRKYTDQNNIERTVTEIAANTLRVLDRDKQGSGAYGQENSDSHAGHTDASTSHASSSDNTSSMMEDGGDLPF